VARRALDQTQVLMTRARAVSSLMAEEWQEADRFWWLGSPPSIEVVPGVTFLVSIRTCRRNVIGLLDALGEQCEGGQIQRLRV
jgi:hypothetical protein